MALKFYPHNEEAYRRAVALMAQTGRAAVIHPTGTGKTFIALRLAEDNPKSRILWLAPSDTIFKTQLESAKQEGFSPKNILFYTYSKLTYLSDEELEALSPDYIVLDEFHRAGAREWGRRVQDLLSLWPEVPLLGLSATNIRYLDGQRDMADELFEGNIASQMTLGEAIVRGILLPPTYITALYSCGQDLKQYERRVASAKNKAIRDAASRYLDALRRALEKADGLPVIFQKYMKADGKYLVFCSDRAAMGKLMDEAEAMFGGVDREFRTYFAYSEDPETDRAFAAFRADGSPHLKLLYCIDMLNEGIHVPDVDGVILFRPTVSPIIYKQQIGRALSAAKEKQPVIFDLVNNFENLYAVGALENEMAEAAGYYRLTGEHGRIVTERFTLIDEARECRALFDALEETLTVPWETMYSHAAAYFREHGDLEVPKRYKTAEGYGLGNWVSVQRRVRAGDAFGRLDEERIRRLDAIGMVWDSVPELRFERNFRAAQQYFEAHGDLNVPTAYRTEDGFALGAWLSNLCVRRESLSEDKISRLDAIGMVWDKNRDRWYRNFAEVKQYFDAHGELPTHQKTAEGVHLGQWLASQRRRREKLSEEQQRLLESVDFSFQTRYDSAWEKNYALLLRYRQRYGDAEIPVTAVFEGANLGKWLSRQRTAERGKLSEEQRQKLLSAGVELDRADPWELRYGLVKDFVQRNGSLKIPTDYKPQGIALYKWLNEQKQIYRGNRRGKCLSEDRIRRLEAIGIQWN